MPRFVFRAVLARRFPDPVFFDDFGVERHILFVNVRDMPSGLPLDPNARIPNIRRRVYREVEASLLNEPEFGPEGSFHLKHKGITLVADRVRKVGDDGYRVSMREGHGIIDGGHTYELILSHANNPDLPEEQYVKVEILTGVQDSWIPALSQGLNTSVQVQAMSLDDLAGRFDSIKDLLKTEPYFSSIAWREGEQGEIDARDIVALMTLFNIALYPNDGSGGHPIIAYSSKAQVLQRFEEEADEYDQMLPILKDVLKLHDIIRKDARKFWNESGGRFGSLGFVEVRKRGQFSFPFTGETAEQRLTNGVLYPLLASFRWFVEKDPASGHYRWRGGFTQVLSTWEAVASELLKMTYDHFSELGRNPQSVGKSRNHWSNLHARVAMRDLLDRQATAAR